VKILSIYWGLSVGGVAKYAATLVRVCEHTPVQLRSLCLLPVGREVDQDVLAMLDAVTIPVRSVVDLSWVSSVRKAIAEEEPDCVISHGFNGHFVSLLATMGGRQYIKRLASYHGAYHPNTPIRRLVSPLYNGFTNWFLANKACAIVCVAQCCVKTLAELGVPASKFTVVHNGIPALTHVPDRRGAIRKEWGFDQSHVIVGIASRFEKIKGLDYLIQSFAQTVNTHENIRLVLIGDGSQRESLQQLAVALGVDTKVSFMGTRSDIPDCLSAMDIFSLPSLSEAHSIGLLEAMRAGKAIVATDVGGNTESVSHEKEALVVNAGDCNALADALSRMVSDAQLRDKLGEAARKRFNAEFTENAMLEKTARWLTKVCCN